MSDIDPLAPDAPLLALLNLRNNPAPFLALSPEEKLARIRELRTIVAQPVTLKAKLASETRTTKKAHLGMWAF